MLKNILYLSVLAIGIPVGLFLSSLCSEEIRNWRMRLLLITGVSLASVIGILFTSYEYKMPVIIGLLFIIVTNFTIFKKSYK